MNFTDALISQISQMKFHKFTRLKFTDFNYTFFLNKINFYLYYYKTISK